MKLALIILLAPTAALADTRATPADHRFRAFINSAMALAGSEAARTAETVATQSAPAATTSPAFWALIPPIAAIGSRTLALASRSPDRPTTGSGFDFVAVGKIGPKPM